MLNFGGVTYLIIYKVWYISGGAGFQPQQYLIFPNIEQAATSKQQKGSMMMAVHVANGDKM